MARKGSDAVQSVNLQVSVDNQLRKKKRFAFATKKNDSRRNLFAIVRKYKPPSLVVEGNQAIKGRCSSHEAFTLDRSHAVTAHTLN